MFLKSNAVLILFIISSWTTTINGTLFEFVLENDEIFDACSEKPGNSGFHEVADLSELEIDFDDGSIRVGGSAKMVWQDVQSTDRIDIKAELLKFQRGTWQPTMYSMRLHDFCSKQFDANSVWYKLWTSHIADDDRKCINNYGHVYHHSPFNVDTISEFPNNMEGRHKIVVKMEAFDNMNVKRPKTYCYEIRGEFVKVK
ncbi:uncharacterized protein [Musca autumnalis]|uniref:uncharacterized protein n=1 Tax=Musca autumnalis TaxID=221902 RepID=UPI003CF603AD